MSTFHYVHILVSASEPSHHFTGLTADLGSRLRTQNAGQIPHTGRHRPWRPETAFAFRSRNKAADFELYLKGHAERGFAIRHL